MLDKQYGRIDTSDYLDDELVGYSSDGRPIRDQPNYTDQSDNGYAGLEAPMG